MRTILKHGLKTVGPPGSGKTALLSTPILFAALNDIPIAITLATGDEFGLLTIDFSAPSNSPTLQQFELSRMASIQQMVKFMSKIYNNNSVFFRLTAQSV
jgi:hypothetical protein